MGEKEETQVFGLPKFWEKISEGKKKERKRKKKKRKKEWKERKKERKEEKGRGGSRRWPAVTGGGRSWPELAGEGGQGSKSKPIVGCKCSSFGENGVLETRLRRTKLYLVRKSVPRRERWRDSWWPRWCR